MIRRFWSFIFIVLITLFLFFPVFRRGFIPLPADFMAAWYEPFKTSFGAGTDALRIAHKPVVDDAFRHLYPLRVIASQIMRAGDMPLWNPFNATGTPLLAIFHPGYMTPFGLFFLFFPPHLAWTIYILLQPLVLGISMYWYMRTLGLTIRAAMFSVVILILSGFAIVRLEYGEFLYVLAGLPLLLGIVERLRVRIRSIRFIIPAVVAVMMLSGQPHMNIYALGVFGLYALVRLPIVRVVGVSAWSILGVLLTSFQFVPSLELFTLSTINQHTSSFIFERFLLPLEHLITIIIPNYFGNQATYNYFGPHDYTETVAYVGSIPVFFALFAVWKSRLPVVRFFAVLTLAAIASTIRWPGAEALFSLPIPVLSADVPSRVFVLSTFAIAVLAGFGFTIWETSKWVKVKYWIVGAGVAVACIAAVTVFLYRTGAQCPPVLPQCRMVSVRTTGIELFGLVLGLTAVSIGVMVHGKLRALFFWIPVGIITMLGLYNAQKFLPFSQRAYVTPDIPVMTALQRETGFDRFATLGSAHIRSNLTSIYGLYSTEYFDPLHVGRYAELISYVNSGDRKSSITRSDVEVVSEATVSADLAFRRERFWDLTGTNILLRKKADGPCRPPLPWNSQGCGIEWEDANWQLVKRPDALPRAYLVQNVSVVPEEHALLSSIFDPKTDLTQTAFVEVPIHGLQMSGTAKGSVKIERYEANRIELSAVSESGPSLMILSDTYYPGWRVKVDGVERTIYRTNYAFRGVVVPQGQHAITMDYQPDSFRGGLFITIASLLVWITIYCYNRVLKGALAKW